MMSILFSFQKYNWEKGCNYNNDTSAHLVDRRSALGKGHEHASRAHYIAGCWDGQQQWVDLGLQRDFVSIFGTWWHWDFLVFSSLGGGESCLDEIDKKAGELTHKHIGALEIRMGEDRRLAVIIRHLNLVLGLHDDSVARSEEEHCQHDTV